MASITVVEGVVSNLVAKALEALSKAVCKEAASWWGARDELTKLEHTMRMIQARVRDAERRQEDDSSDFIRDWLRRLRLLLYRADDLFDEVLTLDRQKQRMERSMVSKVGILFSKSGPLYNRKLAKQIKSIRKELETIKSDMSGLNLTLLPAIELQLPINRLMKKRETASFVNTKNVISRDDDQNIIVEMLCDPKYDQEWITVIPIVGFGGLGKTTLAQLVFNNERVKQHFDLTKWAYVPEKDNLIAIMGKIFKSFTEKDYNNLSLDQIKQGITESIDDKKYLLVLDDLWDEGGDRLIDLMYLLTCGKQGSKVIVTTRSEVVARIIGTIDAPYRLAPLTDDQSWDLFKMLAFKQEKQHNNPTFSVIGKEIVNMCGNVPLAIKVVGGFLRSKDTEKEWLQARDAQRSKAQLTKSNDIMDVLKLSYDYLPPALKQCFAYCSLFPKDCCFDRKDLVDMWMAQGYFEPSNKDAGYLLFLELLVRGFFQDPEFFGGYVKSSKMHDLVHDLAQNVAGEESKLLDIKCPIGDESSTQITDGLVHVNLLRSKAPPSLFVAKRLRSLLLKGDYNNLERLISRFQYLRVLMVEDNWITKLPNSIGRMIHLRYLKIEYKAFKSQTDLKKTLENLQTLIDLKGWNNVSSLMDFSLTHRDLEYLPDSITRLENLQTLNLEHYNALRELPSDLTKLVNLRHLLLPSNSSEWTDFPSGFGNLTSLQELNWFIVGKSNGIDSLPLLSHRGGLKIRFCEWRRNATSEAKRAALKNNDELTSLELWFEEKVTPAFDEMNEMLMHLQLPPNIWELKLRDYKGDAMPTRWLQGLSMLVSIEIEGCKNCKTVPHLSQLPSLKIFQLIDLEELEYVEDEDNVLVGSSGGKLGSVAHNVYFPSLEMLCMIRLPRLKGWTRTSKDDGERRQMLFPQLLEMIVDGCPELISMPVAPKLKSLDVQDIQWKVFESNVALHGDEEAVAASQSSLPPSLSTHFTSLQKLIMDSVEVVWLSISLSNLAELKIKKCEELRRVKFESPNSIQLLKVKKCRRLREIKGWEHLSMLDTLIIEDCEELEMEEEAEDEATNSSSSRCWQWQGLSSLRELKLSMIPKLKKLPSGIVCLTTFQELNISELESLTELPQDIGNLSLLSVLWIVTCPELKSLPTSLLGLTSLETLAILDCPDVAKKCEEPDGEYCHFIQRTPFLISG